MCKLLNAVFDLLLAIAKLFSNIVFLATLLYKRKVLEMLVILIKLKVIEGKSPLHFLIWHLAKVFEKE